jgi:hypothetical protein
MFDPRFHTQVRTVLAWQEAPSNEIVNEHTSHLQTGRRYHMEIMRDHARLDPYVPLRCYVAKTYPRYFGFSLNAGAYAMKHDYRVYQ